MVAAEAARILAAVTWSGVKRYGAAPSGEACPDSRIAAGMGTPAATAASRADRRNECPPTLRPNASDTRSATCAVVTCGKRRGLKTGEEAGGPAARKGRTAR